MSPKDRFLATIQYEPVDRPAAWLGMPLASAEPGLLKHFGVDSMDSLKRLIEDDVYPISVPYDYPPYNQISRAFDFSGRDTTERAGGRPVPAAGFFKDYHDPGDVEKFKWPDPADYLDRTEAKRRARAVDDRYARMGVLWSSHLQDACLAFGMEHALVTLLENPEMFRAVIDRITKFHLRANEIFYESTRGFLDAVLIGNDFGSQGGLMIEAGLLREHVFPGTGLLVDQAKSYGLKVMHHSCGSIFPVIGDIAGLGADIIHPLQTTAEGMDIRKLKEDFWGRVAFCGGIDAQHLLVRGDSPKIAAAVREIREVFPTGLIISPSNEALTPDVPPSNIEAMFISLRQAT